MYRILSLVAVLAVLAVLLPSISSLTVPIAISSNMVLQRGPQQAQVWGTAAAGSVVVLQLDSAQYKTFADADGNWIYAFPAQQASTDRTLTITGDGQTIKLGNIAFGDVYLCSGQSNMGFTVGMSFTANETIADSINYPQLRFISIAQNASLTPLEDAATGWNDGERWVVSQPKYVGGPDWNYMSATCFYYGRALYKLVNPAGSSVVPIGLVNSNWGGTRVEAWTTPQGLAACGPVQSVSSFQSSTPAVLRSSALPIVKDQPDPQTPSVLFNGMIHPFINMRLSGAIWYQGESNSNNATNYACRFPAMITDWRQQFNNWSLRFYFVLLAAYKEGGFPAWPQIRDAQLNALQLPYTGVVSAQDLGDEASPEGPIHPRNKSIIGDRGALIAYHDLYAPDTVYTGPQLYDVIWPIDGSPVQTVILRFQSSMPYNAGLQLLDTAECTACCRQVNGSVVKVFTSDGQIRPTSVIVDSQAFLLLATVDLSGVAPGVNVAGIGLGWEEYQECSLYNSARLPHLPVRLSRP